MSKRFITFETKTIPMIVFVMDITRKSPYVLMFMISQSNQISVFILAMSTVKFSFLYIFTTM